MIFDVRVACRYQKVTLESFLYVPTERALIPPPLIVRGPTPLVSESRMIRHAQ
jgi:hypothetical protein